MISICILTRDEERDLPPCLESVSWCDDVHVVDSGSTDRTAALAAAAGAHVLENAFSSFGQQRNWALAHCAFQHPWILFLDADERSTPAFEAALKTAVAEAPETTAGFYCCWKLILENTWLRRCDSFPKWQFRLLRKGRASFTDFGHGQKEAEVRGDIGYLAEPYLHYAFSKGWASWLSRHNRYSDLEARERLLASISWRQILSPHGSVRNKALKPLVSRIPGWPLLIFGFRYGLKLGFLEGRAGLTYCANMAYYEFLIRLKMRELQPAAGGAGGTIRAPSRGFHNVMIGVFLLALATILLFALEPNRYNSRLHELPRPLAHWLNEHDDFANYFAFAVFGAIVFALPRSASPTSLFSKILAILSREPVRLVLLLALVSGLEIAQLWIPGRVSSLRDVTTGSSGVLTAWLLYRWLRPRGR